MENEHTDSSNGEDEALLDVLEGASSPDETEEISNSDGNVDKSGVKSKAKTVLGMMFPQLTMYGGTETLSVKKSVFIISILYISHIFSAWGDRMWGFILSLLLAILYPGSLLLPGLYGFLVQLFVAVFGTLVGDWVDGNPRMKVAWVSLLTQNGLLVLCSILLALMFQLDWGVCDNEVIFAALVPMVIILGAGANLATVANTISIEKDWIVVIADKHDDTLAALNSNMRRIDLCCKLLAPAITGIFLQWAKPFATTLFVATWNVVSFFAELSLIWVVFRLVPPLAKKKYRKKSSVNETDKEVESNDDDVLSGQTTDNDEGDKEREEMTREVFETRTSTSTHCRNRATKVCSKLLTPLFTLKDGWKIYIRQEIALIGFAMASIYLTVLGFSGVTASYLLTQGLRYDLIGVCQGVGAIFGVTGTILYPFIRKRVGTVRTGLFGITTQVIIMMFCVAAVFVPSNRIESKADGYYSPDCNNTVPLCSNDSIVCGSPSTVQQFTTFIQPTATEIPSTSFQLRATPTPSQPTPSTTYTPSHSTPLPTHTPTPSPNTESSQISVALILLLAGVIGCRIGLWTFDLAVQQLVQEKVVEEERGVVGGVMNAMNSIMDMLHYVLVIAAPRPEHFGILTIISVAMVILGLVLYGAYVRKSRGHFFHFRDCYRRGKQCVEKRCVSDQDVGVASPLSFINDSDEDTTHLIDS